MPRGVPGFKRKFRIGLGDDAPWPMPANPGIAPWLGSESWPNVVNFDGDEVTFNGERILYG